MSRKKIVALALPIRKPARKPEDYVVFPLPSNSRRSLTPRRGMSSIPQFHSTVPTQFIYFNPNPGQFYFTGPPLNVPQANIPIGREPTGNSSLVRSPPKQSIPNTPQWNVPLFPEGMTENCYQLDEEIESSSKPLGHSLPSITDLLGESDIPGMRPTERRKPWTKRYDWKKKPKKEDPDPKPESTSSRDIDSQGH